MSATGDSRKLAALAATGAGASMDDGDVGRVRVFARIRPFKQAEKDRKETTAITVESDRQHMTVLENGRPEKKYDFDGVFDESQSNEEVYRAVGRPIVNAALSGFNGTLMAYGQTGTGKTHTLASSDGIIPRVVNNLFRKIAKDKAHVYRVSCAYLQIYQEKIHDLLTPSSKNLALREHPEKGVYVENLSEYVVRSPKEVFELLVAGRKQLVFAETKMNRHSSRSHAICLLTVERALNKEAQTDTRDDARTARKHPPAPRENPPTQRRADGDTAPDGASRTESVITGDGTGEATPRDPDGASLVGDTVSLAAYNYDATDDGTASIMETTAAPEPAEDGAVEFEWERQDDDDMDAVGKLVEGVEKDAVLRGRITLCDLAGSERVRKTDAAGDRLTEAQHINLSLLELGNVIHALTDARTTHVPFRNSTLTRLLQESLGGNCKTSLVVCVSPSPKDASETKSTLNFGSRAKRVKNSAHVNIEVDYKILANDLAIQMEAKESEWRHREAGLAREIEALRAQLTHAEEELARRLAELDASRAADLGAKEASLLAEISAERARATSEAQRARRAEDRLARWLESTSHVLARDNAAVLRAELASLQMYRAFVRDHWDSLAAAHGEGEGDVDDVTSDGGACVAPAGAVDGALGDAIGAVADALASQMGDLRARELPLDAGSLSLLPPHANVQQSVQGGDEDDGVDASKLLAAFAGGQSLHDVASTAIAERAQRADAARRPSVPRIDEGDGDSAPASPAAAAADTSARDVAVHAPPRGPLDFGGLQARLESARAVVVESAREFISHKLAEGRSASEAGEGTVAAEDAEDVAADAMSVRFGVSRDDDRLWALRERVADMLDVIRRQQGGHHALIAGVSDVTASAALSASGTLHVGVPFGDGGGNALVEGHSAAALVRALQVRALTHLLVDKSLIASLGVLFAAEAAAKSAKNEHTSDQGTSPDAPVSEAEAQTESVRVSDPVTCAEQGAGTDAFSSTDGETQTAFAVHADAGSQAAWTTAAAGVQTDPPEDADDADAIARAKAVPAAAHATKVPSGVRQGAWDGAPAAVVDDEEDEGGFGCCGFWVVSKEARRRRMEKKALKMAAKGKR